MRKIKFRGKEYDGTWHAGDLYTRNGEDFIIREYYIDRHTIWDCMVDPDTIGQFTGQYDKRGKEIYEGDIVKYEHFIKGDLVYQIVWNEYKSSFMRQRMTDDGTVFAPLHMTDYVTIIGNIHDNPELLKEGGES